MFEITYEKAANLGDAMNTILAKGDAVYDFTFENRFHIFHRPRKNIWEYITLDSTTGRTSMIFEVKELIKPEAHLLLVNDILRSIRYTGDLRSDEGICYTGETLIDLIFRVVMPENGYAVRESQIQMAKTIFQSLRYQKAALCEAEVGSGKTLAYLVAGLAAKANDNPYSYTGYPVTITTSSIELQKAILEKELPALSRMLQDARIISKPLTAVLRKGKEHYFCPKRYLELISSLRQAPQNNSRVLSALGAMNLLDHTLDLDPLPLGTHIKSKICVKGSCYGCRREKECKYAQFIAKATKRYQFDFQIVNHNLFLNTQKMRLFSSLRKGPQPCNFCIIDEAHKLLDTAMDVFGAEVRFTDITDYLLSVRFNGGSTLDRRSDYRERILEAVRLNNKLFSMFSHYTFDRNEDICETEIKMTTGIQHTLEKLIAVLDEIGKWDLPQCAAKNSSSAFLIEKLSSLLNTEDNLIWLSYDKATNTKTLCSTPTNLKVKLRSTLWTWPNMHLALTSGTMQDDTGFSFFKDELGITGCLDKYSISEFACASPFDYQNNTRLYISENTPIPDMQDPEYIPAIAKEIAQLIRATYGHTAVLFTSYKTLSAVYDLVAKENTQYPLIKMSRSNKNAIAQFKNSKNGVLFASGSMWEGVDCPGDILSSVIIVRLPFPLRTQALESKKNACANTLEFVQTYAVPQMIIKLRQGAGRLIRTETDTGILAILDARAAKGGAYRSRVLKALRKYPLVHSIQDVAKFIDSVKDDSYREEGLV